MQQIYRYLDYRQFLADYYKEKKRTTRFFSYRYFANKIGTSSPVFLSQVIEGKRKLTSAMIERFSAAIGFNKREALFFRNLVLFNQSKSPDEKQNYYIYLLTMMDCIDELQLTADQFRYFSKWYNVVIRELITIHDFRDDFERLAKAVVPAITPSQARKSVELLIRLNLIRKKEDGTYVQTTRALTSGRDPMVSLARRTFNGKMAELGLRANNEMTMDERSVSGITLGASRACYEVLLVELDAFKKRVISIVNNNEKSTRVYQFNFQLFPLSREMMSSDRDGAAQ